jgi:hypothetical protein
VKRKKKKQLCKIGRISISGKLGLVGWEEKRRSGGNKEWKLRI